MDWKALHAGFSWLEWELGAEPLELVVVDPEKKLPPAIRKLKISRDDEYRLKVEYEASGLRPADLWGKEDGGRRGWRTIEPVTIHATMHGHGKPEFVLTGCVDVGRNGSSNHLTGETTVQGRLQVWSIRFQDETEEQPDRIVEWYLNGPRDWFYWPDLTDIDITLKMVVERKERDHAGEMMTKDTYTSEPSSGSVNAIFVSGTSFKAVVYGVPKEIGPSWGAPIGIEYRAEWGIPDEETRQRIAYGISFGLGTELLHVGTSAFRGDWRLWAEARDMRAGPTRRICAASQFAPFNWDHGASSKADLARTVDSYLANDSQLDLEACIGYYWLASRSPLGYNFPFFAAAMEGLVRRWAKVHGSKSVATLMDPPEFVRLAREPIKAIVTAAPDTVRVPLERHLLNANNWSGNQQWKRALAELGITLSELEEEALDKRHVFAHGKAADDLLQSGRAFDLERAYRSLFIRLVLAILGHQGNFLDHTPSEPEHLHMDAQTLPARIVRGRPTF